MPLKTPLQLKAGGVLKRQETGCTELWDKGVFTVGQRSKDTEDECWERQEENHRERWPRNQVKKVLQERGSEMSRELRRELRTDC